MIYDERTLVIYKYEYLWCEKNEIAMQNYSTEWLVFYNGFTFIYSSHSEDDVRQMIRGAVRVRERYGCL